MKSRELNKVALVSIASYIGCSVRVSFPFRLSNSTPLLSQLSQTSRYRTAILRSQCPLLSLRRLSICFSCFLVPPLSYQRHSHTISMNSACTMEASTGMAGRKSPEYSPCRFKNQICTRQRCTSLTLWNSGASYTATGFDWKNGVQPSPNNPLGNPSSYKGHTATNGPNFVMYLTSKYNKSSIQTYDFAWAGSPVPGMVRQVENEFVPYYAGNGKLDPGWNPAKTLFAIFVGINDLDSWSKGSSYRNNVFKQYSGAIDTVSHQMQLCTLNLAGSTDANMRD